MGAGYINEETPETQALLYRLEQYFGDSFMLPTLERHEKEQLARDVARLCGAYREHRVEL